MNKKNVQLLIVILLIPCVIVFYYASSYLYWSLSGWRGLDYAAEIKQNLRQLDAKELTKKINLFNLFSPCPSYSIGILADRKEKDAVPTLIRILESKNSIWDNEIIWALSKIQDERAIAPLIKILKKGEEHKHYVDALDALSVFKYEGAFENVLALANKPNAYGNGCVEMLKNFEKPEYIPLLEDIKTKVDEQSPFASLNHKKIDKAIAHLESIQKQQEESRK